MLILEGDQRPINIDIRLAALLSGVAGAVNAAGFQATGLFSANMTGNMSAMADGFALGRFGPAALFASLIVAFILGAFTSGLLIEAGRRRGVRAIYAYSITFEAALLIAIGLADLVMPVLHGDPVLILLLSTVMGLQNAATTRISNARVRTTHVSGMATDIGLGLAGLLSSSPQSNSAVARLRLHGAAITAFLLGGIAGVWIYATVGAYVFFAASAILLAIALPEIRRARRQ